MIKRHALVVAALAAFAACKPAPKQAEELVPIKEVVAGVEMIDFELPEAKFACRAPANWGVREAKYLAREKGVSFTGLVDPQADLRTAKPGSLAHISILRYPESEKTYTDAQKYAETFWQLTMDMKQPEITKEKIGDQTVIRFHYERMPNPPLTRHDDKPNRLDYALFPVKGGFYEIELTSPAGAYPKVSPVFEAVVRSFKPKT